MVGRSAVICGLMANGVSVLPAAMNTDSECTSSEVARDSVLLQLRVKPNQVQSVVPGAPAQGASLVVESEIEVGERLESKFMTNRASKAFTFSSTHGSFSGALSQPFHWHWRYPFGLSAHQVSAFLHHELLASNPFGDDGVPVPWPEEGGDQLGDGGYVTYSRRQVCYITAQHYLGATTPGYDSGLARLMHMCRGHGDFRRSFATLLAACAADPTLKNGGQGPLLVVAKADAKPSVSTVRAAAEQANLDGAGLRYCDYDAGAPPLSGVERVPVEGCVPRTAHAPGTDFMTGGLKGQATQDISAAWFGGYLFDAHACGLGGGQDERLSVYFPEVTALAYFLSQSHPFPQLRQPVWVLGARNFFTTLDGTARFDHQLKLAEVPMDSDLVDVQVAGETFSISSSRPFLVFMSESQGFFQGHASMRAARENREPLQRDMGHGNFSFEKQVRAWYRSVALTSYPTEVQPALKSLVSSIGAGPWLAGLWWGDSQLGILAMMLGQAIAAPTWGQQLSLDYYIYSSFTENAGNQCFVLPKDACGECMSRCESPSPTRKSFWMPKDAYVDGKPCMTSRDKCGTHGLQDIVARYRGQMAGAVWSEIERKLGDRSVSRTVFDELLA